MSSVIAPFLIGTLKSTRTKTRLPVRSRSVTRTGHLQPLLAEEAQQVDAAARIAPLVVVPRQDLHEVAVHDAGVRRVEDRRVGVAAEVDRDELASLYCRMPFSGPSAAALNAALTSSFDVFLSTTTARSTTETFGVGTRIAMPSSLPFSSGSTSPTAIAAPVVVGMIDSAAARARRRSLCGRSSSCWSFVYECTVVIQPLRMPNVSCSTFATGARQFVVHDAFEMMWCFAGSYLSSLTPSTIVMSGFFAGAVMMTFFAPAAMCLAAPSRFGEDARSTRTRRRRRASSTAAAPGPSTDRTWNSSLSDRDAVALGRDVGLQVAEDRVVLEQVGERLGVGQVVDGDDVDAAVVHGGAHDVAADAAEPVDPDFDGHLAILQHR